MQFLAQPTGYHEVVPVVDASLNAKGYRTVRPFTLEQFCSVSATFFILLLAPQSLHRIHTERPHCRNERRHERR